MRRASLRKSGVAVAILIAALASAMALTAAAAVAPSDAEAATAAKKSAIKKTKKAVRKQIPGAGTPGLAAPAKRPKIKVSSCKTKGKKFRCSWAAKGEAPGLVPFRCAGKATVVSQGRKVKRIDPCENKLEQQAPLLAQPNAFEFGYFEDFNTHPLFAELAAGGADVAREGIIWKLLQPQAPSAGEDPQRAWNWGPSDALYRDFQAVGVRPIWTFSNAPCWAADPSVACAPGGAGFSPPSQAAVADYARAAAEIAKRYPNSAGIEIWQEPNGVKFWGARPDPARFSELVGQSAAAVDATGSGVAVISGGLAPGAASADKLEYGEFTRQAVSQGGILAADSVAFHAVTEVPFKPGADPTTGYLGRLRIQIETLTDALGAGGDSPPPVVLTQLSYSTVGYSEDQQAEALASSVEVAARIPGLSLVIVSRLLDEGDGSKVSGFGVLRPNGSPKPAYCALAATVGAPNPPGC